jgi:peptidoglycan hydrolase-like protein with peptidoglycan-binding domain
MRRNTSLKVVLTATAALIIVGGAGIGSAIAATADGPADARATSASAAPADGKKVNLVGEDIPAAPEVPPAKASAKKDKNAEGEDGEKSTAPVGEDAEEADATAPATGPCAETGPTQKLVEEYLDKAGKWGEVTVDGKQSAKDCAAIKKFQERFGIDPAAGYAGPLTGRVATRLKTSDYDECMPKKGLTVCVDLTAQTMWVVKDGAIKIGPTLVRTGRSGLATPDGDFKITEKKVTTVSSYYGAELPYWQRFHGDMGFHETPSYLYDGGSPGSHGCINVLSQDADTLYEMTSLGTKVHIFGRKPGT